MSNILTSIHGRRFGLAADGKAVVNRRAGNASLVECTTAGSVQHTQGAPGALNATGTLTAALIRGGIVTSTTASAVTATLNTGAAMDTALPNMAIGDAFEWSAIKTGANTFTVAAAATGHTIVGAGAVATVTSGRFLTRKTAAATYITYRLA